MGHIISWFWQINLITLSLHKSQYLPFEGHTPGKPPPPPKKSSKYPQQPARLPNPRILKCSTEIRSHQCLWRMRNSRECCHTEAITLDTVSRTSYSWTCSCCWIKVLSQSHKSGCCDVGYQLFNLNAFMYRELWIEINQKQTSGAKQLLNVYMAPDNNSFIGLLWFPSYSV